MPIIVIIIVMISIRLQQLVMEKVGTMVLMRLENETERDIAEVFNMYTDIDEGFVKTKIPVKEACINGEPVARSQVMLHPVNMLPVVARMIRHVSRGTIPENICLEL